MANSGTVTAGSAALASQYNNLRSDVLNVSTGHTHTGASENGAKVAATGVSSGTAALNAVLTADGSGGASFLALAAAGADVQEFTSSGSWVKPAGKSAVYVLAIGDGGGGGGGGRGNGVVGYGGDGGHSGAHAATWIPASNLSGTVTVTIGAGGAGGTAQAAGSTDADGAAGATGGDTTFGTAFSARGGFAGRRAAQNGTAFVPTGVAEWSYFNANGGTTDVASAQSVNANSVSTFMRHFTAGIGGEGGIGATRAFNRAGGGGGGGNNFGTFSTGGMAGARGFGNNGTIILGGAGGSAVPGAAGTAGSVNGNIGTGGGGGGDAYDANGGIGGAGYLGGGGGGGGGVYRDTGNRATGAGGAGGGGYILVISV